MVKHHKIRNSEEIGSTIHGKIPTTWNFKYSKSEEVYHAVTLFFEGQDFIED